MVDADMSRPPTRAWGESALSRSSEKRLMVFAGTSNQELAKGIAQRLGIRLGDVIIKDFANGETYVKFDESVRGADVFLDPVARTARARSTTSSWSCSS